MSLHCGYSVTSWKDNFENMEFCSVVLAKYQPLMDITLSENGRAILICREDDGSS